VFFDSPERPLFGAHIHKPGLPWLLPKQVVHVWLHWKAIEHVQDEYDWLAPDVPNGGGTPDGMVYPLAGQYPLLLNLFTTPEWYATDPTHENSQIRPDCYGKFADFALAAIERYLPFAGEWLAISLCREPNAWFYQTQGIEHWTGGWGQDGESYAQMVSHVYSVVKSVYPQVKVVAGELGWSDNANNQFAQRMLRTGFLADVLSLHHYTYHTKDGLVQMEELWQFVSSVSKCGLPIWLTETAVLSSADTEDFEQNQVLWLNYLAERCTQYNVRLVLWLTLANNSWRNCSLVWLDQPRPGYDVLKALCSEQ